jgi:hypothetical protein
MPDQQWLHRITIERVLLGHRRADVRYDCR